MKRFPLLPLAALVFAVAYACSDSTAPANSHSLLSPRDPTATRGDPPPPPVDVAMTITIHSVPHIAPFTGVYFSNGILDEVGTPSETFDGTAWLRLDNKQPAPAAGNASPNTRFMARDNNLSGMGTLTLGGVVFKIVRVDRFTPFSNCGSLGQTCAIITFVATDNTGAEHSGEATAFNATNCTIVEVSNGEEEEGSHLEFSCPPPASEP